MFCNFNVKLWNYYKVVVKIHGHELYVLPHPIHKCKTLKQNKLDLKLTNLQIVTIFPQQSLDPWLSAVLT